MKNKTFVSLVLVVGLIAGCMTEKHESKESKEAKQAKLQAMAKVSQADAQATALAKVPGGMVKESELEKEHGKVVWSFDIATPDSKDITEVTVDAVSGQVMAVEKETPKEQATEAAEDAKKKKD